MPNVVICDGCRGTREQLDELREQIRVRDRAIDAQLAYMTGLIDGLRALVPPTNAVGKPIGSHARDSL